MSSTECVNVLLPGKMLILKPLPQKIPLLDFLGEAGRGTALGLLRPEGKPLSIPANYAASYALLRVLSVLRGKLPSAAQRKPGPPPGLPHFQRPKMGEEF